MVDENACDRYIAGEITGLAEEVHKLTIALEREQRWTAGVQRSVLALHLPRVMSVHLRVLYGSEHVLRDAVADLMEDQTREAQGVALGEKGQSLRETCLAALQLYVLAAQAFRDLLDDEPRQVEDHACGLTARMLGTGAEPRQITMPVTVES